MTPDYNDLCRELKNFIPKNGTPVYFRPSTKFIKEIRSIPYERILFFQDGHMVTTDRVIKI